MTAPHDSGLGSVIDSLSMQIIEQLQDDGRRPYATIGKAIGLSEAAVRQRVQRLIDSQAMQIVAVANPSQLGYRRRALINIAVGSDVDAAAEQIAAIPEVECCVITAGPSDILAQVICTDDQELLRVVTQIRGVPGVHDTTTSLYLSVKKQEQHRGFPYQAFDSTS